MNRVEVAMKRSFLPLFVTNFFGTVNDNFLKTLASFVVMGWLVDPGQRPLFMGITAGALVLPYVLFSPLADRLTVVFPKRKVLRLAKWAELPIMAVAVSGFVLRSPGLVVGAVVLMGLQSALYSPSKYALVRDIGGVERISTGMGGMEGVAFLGVLSGTILASLAVDRLAPWMQYGALVLFAVAGLVSSYAVRADEEPNRAVHVVNPVRYLRRAHRMAKGYPGLNAVIFTLSVFWWAAAMLQMGLLVYGREALGLDATHTGILLCAAAVGIVAGQIIAGFVDRRHCLLGVTLLTGWLAAALLAVLCLVPMGPVPFGVTLAVLAFDLGFFKLPLDAEIQKVVKGPRLNTMLSYFNQVSFLFMLVASGCYALVSRFGPGAFLLLLSAVFALAPVAFLVSYRKVLLDVGRRALHRRYDVTVEGLEILSASAPATAFLVLPNHPALVDPMLVLTELSRRPLRPLVDEAFFHVGLVSSAVLRTLGAVPVPDLRKHRTAPGAKLARGLDGVVLSALSRGGDVVLYPSGHIQTEADHDDIGTRQLAYNLCGNLPEGVTVIGVRTRGLWGSIWSRKGRSRSPNFVLTLVRALALWLFAVPFLQRRKVTMQLEDLTDRTREWSKLTRLEFNRRLEGWYNV